MHCCCVLIRTLALGRLFRHNDAIYRHRLAFMLYAYWSVKKLRSIGLKTHTIIKLIGDELISH